MILWGDLIIKTMEILVENIVRRGVVTGYEFTEDEFLEEIRKAERGPFFSIDELEQRIEKWKMSLTEKM